MRPVCSPILLARSAQRLGLEFVQIVRPSLHHLAPLFDAAAEPKRLLEIRGGHNDGFLASGAIYRDALAAFLAAAGDARKRSTDPIPGPP